MKTNSRDTDLYSMRKIPVQARAKSTVEAILQAAAQLLIDQGYDQASTNQIVEVAGVSIGTLYEYFPGKESVFAELRRRQSTKHYDLITAEPRPTTPHEMLRHLVVTHIKHVRENLPLHVALVTEVPRFAIASTEAAILDDYIPQSDAFLEFHQSELRPDVDVPFLTEFLMRVLSSTINDYALHSPDRLESSELLNEVVDLLGRYLLNEP